MMISNLRSNEESKNKSRHLSQSWVNKRARAKYQNLTSLAPGWLKANEKRHGFDTIPERETVVRTIIEWALSGMGTHAIVTRLNRQKVPTFGRSTGWSKSSVNKILKSHAIFGEYQPHTKPRGGKRTPVGEPIADYFPPIVDRETYDRIQLGRLSRRLRGMGRKGDRYSNLFSKIAVCGLCGEPMHYENKGEPPKGGKYLCCRGNKRFTCTAKPWRYDLFERAFLAHVRPMLQMRARQQLFNKHRTKSTSSIL